ncbi:MAG: thioredoxin [Candidatus Hydrogenedentota bacterium]
MSAETELTNKNFDSVVGKGVTLVDFWAEWCGPCKMMDPVLQEVATEYDGKLTVGKVNVDNESDLAVKYNVSSIPTLLLVKDGEVQKQFVGVTSKGDLKKAIDAVVT